jgi:hypothetical protein
MSPHDVTVRALEVRLICRYARPDLGAGSRRPPEVRGLRVPRKKTVNFAGPPRALVVCFLVRENRAASITGKI